MVVKKIKTTEDCYSERDRVIINLIDKKLQGCWDNLKKFTKEDMEKADEKHFPKPIEKSIIVETKKDIDKQYPKTKIKEIKVKEIKVKEKVEIRKEFLKVFRKNLDILNKSEMHVKDLAEIMNRTARVLYKWNENTIEKFLKKGMVDIFLLKKYIDDKRLKGEIL